MGSKFKNSIDLHNVFLTALFPFQFQQSKGSYAENDVSSLALTNLHHLVLTKYSVSTENDIALRTLLIS